LVDQGLTAWLAHVTMSNIEFVNNLNTIEALPTGRHRSKRGCRRVGFRLLGKLPVTVSGSPVELGATKLRAVLVTLLADVNQVVPDDE
jgi:hypothetical protein